MASHFGTVLVAEAAASTPKLWFGVPEGRIGELPDHTYTLTKNLAVYRRTIHNDVARLLGENDVLTYGIESKNQEVFWKKGLIFLSIYDNELVKNLVLNKCVKVIKNPEPYLNLIEQSFEWIRGVT